MTTTVAQMIAWLQTLPPDAVVECGMEVTRNYETYMSMEAVDLEACTVLEYTSENDRIAFPHMAGKSLVMIRAD
jgi:hypothetical protein